MFKRIILFITLFKCLTLVAQQNAAYSIPLKLSDGLKTASLKSVGIDKQIIMAMQDSVAKGVYPNIHSILIIRKNKLVYEKYFHGKDELLGRNLGVRNHHRDSLHDIRSISKSVTSAAVMIAISQGKIKSVDQRVFDFFPEYAKYDTAMKRQMTIKHLLNMTNGLEWNEEVSYLDTLNSERKLYSEKDPVEYFLSRRSLDVPGTIFNYSGGCTQTLAAIIKKSTGMRIDSFVNKYLFTPLGITDFFWIKRRLDSLPLAFAGLRLRSRDMAKFGLLFMNNGIWNGKQIIPSQLIAQTLKTQITTALTYPGIPHVGYSNQFRLITQKIQDKQVTFVEAHGNGGQLIVIDNNNNLVLVVTAGNYNRSGLPKSSYDLYPDFVFPALIRK